MITFISLFIGLVTGYHPVEVAVRDPVAAVEIRLDGATVQTLTGPPWIGHCDFGDDLRPHELVAVARDAEGEEVGRARQWVNLPRSLAEANLILERDEAGKARHARLVWQSMEASGPRRVALTFDGQPLEVADPHSFALPDYDPRRLHMLVAELEFSIHVRTQVEVALGGVYGGTVTTELTAVPLARVKRRAPRTAGELSGLLLHRGEPLTVIATEEEGADIVVVLERSANLGLGGLGLALRLRTFPDVFLELAEGERVRFMFAQPLERDEQEMRFDVFPMSQPFTGADGRLEYLLTHVKSPERDTGQRIADAIAVAAVQAAGSNRPRVVLLILGTKHQDASLFPLPGVRRFLETLHVPLVVWSTGEGGSLRVSEDRRSLTTATDWGKARDISSLNRLVASIREMREVLDSQVIVWVEGSYLPQDIALSRDAKGIELVR